MAFLLAGEALHLEYPTRVVFDGVTAGLNEGDRIGVVGRNGDGKSSLLGMLAGRITPDGGRVLVRGGVRIGVLDQADTLPDELTVAHAIVGDAPEHEWAGDARVRDVIAGLVADLPWDAPLGTLSGGQRRRVALAALLVGDWDVLMLDEPTNHLDMESIIAFNDGMISFPGIVLFTTHDHQFMQTVANRIIEITPKGMIDKLMTYDEYLEDERVKAMREELYTV